jgi:hypothetical protein
MAHGRSTRGDSLSVEDLAGAALDSDLVTGQIFVVNCKNSPPTRESTDPRPVMTIFGGTEIPERDHRPRPGSLA